MEIGLAIANPILQGTGSPEVTARDVLKDTVIFIRYDVVIRLSDFDWTPRFFGDIDNNSKVEASDARTALRYSVGLDKIRNERDLIFSDVDFDGVVTAVDAREILRMSIGLNELFSDVPEGKTIKIVVLIPPKEETPDAPEDGEAPDAGEAPDDGEAPDEGEGTENPDGEENGAELPSLDDVTGGVSDFITAIFDIVNGFSGGDVSDEGIGSIIQDIKDIIESSKNDIIGGGTNDGGIIIVPDPSTENA